MIYLNLASGTDLRDPPWRNLDIVPRWPGADRGCDEIWDARKDRLNYADNSVESVYAGYLFLHLAPQHHQRVLADILRVLKPGGTLVVSEVDMPLVFRRWLEDPTNKQCTELIWGEQGDVHGADLADFDKHCHGFSEYTLAKFLCEGGFPRVQRIWVHRDQVWYELTMRAHKES